MVCHGWWSAEVSGLPWFSACYGWWSAIVGALLWFQCFLAPNTRPSSLPVSTGGQEGCFKRRLLLEVVPVEGVGESRKISKEGRIDKKLATWTGFSHSRDHY